MTWNPRWRSAGLVALPAGVVLALMAFPAPLAAGQVAPDKNAQQVTFAKDRPEVEKSDRKDTVAGFSGKATTTATFSEPGEYELYVVANDYSGEGGAGFQCCWTNGLVKVSVQP